jgi:hypothetical protein
MDASMRSTLRKNIAEQGRGRLEAQGYVEALRKEFPVKVAEDRL